MNGTAKRTGEGKYPGPRPPSRYPGGRRRLWLGVLMLLLLVLVAGGVAATVYRTFESSGETAADNTGSATTAAPLQGVETVTPQTNASEAGAPNDSPDEDGEDSLATAAPAHFLTPDTTEASSALPPQDGNTYGADNLIDQDLTTAWNEDAEGWGEGEWVYFEFSSPVVLSHIEIANGYQKESRIFRGNGRVRTIRIEYSGGESTTANLADALGYQSVDTAAHTISWLRLTVLSVYEGRLWQDTALSEVRFYGREE